MSNPLLLRADARALPLADASVDLVITSPPYYALRSYIDGGERYAGQLGAERTPAEYITALVECTREWVRVLKPQGNIFVNLGDKYAGQGTLNNRAGQVADFGVRDKCQMNLPERYRIACTDQLRLIQRAVIVWSKNALPESATDRVRRSHEDWVHLVKQPQYYSSVDAIRAPHLAKPQRRLKPHENRASGNIDRKGGWSGLLRGEPQQDGNPLGALPGSVWEIATEPLKVPDDISHAVCCQGRKREACTDGVDHFAAFPSEWPRRIILGWSPVGGMVLDPFGGTGTTALIAEALGRQGISVDRSADYCRLAAWRTNDPGQRAKARGVPKPAPVPAGQGDLFDLAGGEPYA